MAYLEHRQVLLGLVYDPIADELFWATRGEGAWLDSPRAAAAGGRAARRARRRAALKRACPRFLVP